MSDLDAISHIAELSDTLDTLLNGNEPIFQQTNVEQRHREIEMQQMPIYTHPPYQPYYHSQLGMAKVTPVQLSNSTTQINENQQLFENLRFVTDQKERKRQRQQDRRVRMKNEDPEAYGELKARAAALKRQARQTERNLYPELYQARVQRENEARRKRREERETTNHNRNMNASSGTSESDTDPPTTRRPLKQMTDTLTSHHPTPLQSAFSMPISMPLHQMPMPPNKHQLEPWSLPVVVQEQGHEQGDNMTVPISFPFSMQMNVPQQVHIPFPIHTSSGFINISMPAPLTMPQHIHIDNLTTSPLLQCEASTMVPEKGCGQPSGSTLTVPLSQAQALTLQQQAAAYQLQQLNAYELEPPTDSNGRSLLDLQGR